MSTPLIPATLVTGLPGSKKSAFIQRALRVGSRPLDVVAVRWADELNRHLGCYRGSRLIVEAHGLTEPLDLFDVFRDEPAGSRFSLEGVVAVVDATRILMLFHQRQDIPEASDGRALVEILVNQIELASAVAVVNESPDPAATMRVRDLIRALNPTAPITTTTGRPDAIQFDPDRCLRDAAWLQVPTAGSLVSGDLDVFKYRRTRPFHPQRLAAVLDAGWPGVLRSKGFVWIASRGEERGVYVQAGGVWRLGPGGPWWASLSQSEWPDGEDELADIRASWDLRTGDRRQEIVFVGIGLRREDICRELDACLLDARELAAGAASWVQFPDPLATWEDEGSEPTEVLAEAAVAPGQRAVP